MEDADGIAQWNASGSRKNSIVTAAPSAEQLGAIVSRYGLSHELVPEREGAESRQKHLKPGMYHSSTYLNIDTAMI